MFTSFPSSKQYFSDFQNMKDVEEIQASGLLKKHALRVLNGLDALVENILDEEKMASMISLMAKSHAQKHKLKAVFFKVSTDGCSRYSFHLCRAAEAESVVQVEPLKQLMNTHTHKNYHKIQAKFRPEIAIEMSLFVQSICLIQH